jgi:hypothetical protein
MSAECAFAMVEIVHWATDISYAVPVRIITISNATPPESLKRLVDHYGHADIQTVMFKSPEKTLQQHQAEDMVYVPS